MIRIRATADLPGPSEEVWALLTDWRAHTRWVPATTVTVLEDTGGVGTRFVGRSGLGPVAFDDPMTVVDLEPPTEGRAGRCVIRKTGRVVLGDAGFTVTPTGPRTSSVTWWEDVTVAPRSLTRWFEPVLERAGQRSFSRVLRAVAAELARDTSSGPAS